MHMGAISHAAGAWFAGASWRRVVTSLAIVIGAFLLVQAFRLALNRARAKFTAAAAILYIVEQLGGYLIIIAGVLGGLTTLGIDLRSLSLFGGALGVGIGLGLQGVVKEFVSGLVLIFDPSIQVGDFVEIDDKLRGDVVAIGPRATRIRTNDDVNVIIPNSALVQNRIVNWTLGEESRRFHVPFSVAEDSDIAQVRDLVLAAAKGVPFTLPDTAERKTRVWLTGFAGSGLSFDLVLWPTRDSTRHPSSLHAAYTSAIHHALRGAGIANANPQFDLRVRSLFGREDEQALQLFGLSTLAKAAPPPAVSDDAPNDAVAEIYEAADRSRRHRAEDAQQRPGFKATSD